jgi:hypothetical protein
VVRLTTGTTDKATANAIERAVKDLVVHREKMILNALLDGTIAAGDVFDASRSRSLDALRAQPDDVNLEPHVAVFLARYGQNVAADTIAHYAHVVRSLISEGVPFPRSAFTVDKLDSWLAAYPAYHATRRKAHSAMSNFAKYLVRMRVLGANPMRSIDAPPANPPRLRCPR